MALAPPPALAVGHYVDETVNSARCNSNQGPPPRTTALPGLRCFPPLARRGRGGWRDLRRRILTNVLVLTESKWVEISQDTFIQIAEMDYDILTKDSLSRTTPRGTGTRDQFPATTEPAGNRTQDGHLVTFSCTQKHKKIQVRLGVSTNTTQEPEWKDLKG